MQAVEVQDTQLSVKAEAQVPGFQYEAKVRARRKTGLWSEWSPLVTWLTEEGEWKPYVYVNIHPPFSIM